MAHVGEADFAKGAMAPYSTPEAGFGELVTKVSLGPMCGPSVRMDLPRVSGMVAALAEERRPRRGRHYWSLRLAACQGVSTSPAGPVPGSRRAPRGARPTMRQFMSRERERAGRLGWPEEGLLKAIDCCLSRPYLSERQWAIVREAYSQHGAARGVGRPFGLIGA